LLVPITSVRRLAAMQSFANRIRQGFARRAHLALNRASQRAPIDLVVPVRSRLLVVSPHMDDEALACGGTLLLHKSLASVVRVVYVSDSSVGLREPAAADKVRATRRAEMNRVREALALHSVAELNFPDTALVRHEAAIAERMADELKTFSPSQVLCPFPLDAHGDHQACAHALSAAIRASGWQGEVLAYEVWSALWPTVAIDIGAVVDDKIELIRLYDSQMAFRDYVSAIIGLNRYRGLPHGVSFAEAFHRCGASEFVALTSSLSPAG
jgi:N-acetylglucosamine malate deacetylase 1